MDALEKAPQLPVIVLLAIAAVSSLTLVLAWRRVDSLTGIFLLTAIWLRIISGAFHDITFAPVVGGLSINALLSVATVAAGVALVNRDTFVQRWVMPIYGLIALAAVSAMVNRAASGFVDMFFKWGLVIVLIAAVRQAMLKSGKGAVLYMVMYCYAPILVFQILSFVLGYGKDTEGADAISYIGGYNHEAAFSVMVVTFAAIVLINPKMPFPIKFGFLMLSAFSILLANYRTAIISLLPLIGGAVFIEGLALFSRKSRAFAMMLMLPLAILIVAIGADALATRFADIGLLLTEYDRFLLPPEYYTEPSKKVLSGRLFIWSSYVYGYLNSNDLQLAFGFGPNGWVGVFLKYAHNTLVSYLYELGPLGVIALLIIWFTFLSGTMQVRDTDMRRKLLCAQASFILLNFATMPHWLIEGILFYALIQGTMLCQLSTERSAAVAARSSARQPGRPESSGPAGGALGLPFT